MLITKNTLTWEAAKELVDFAIQKAKEPDVGVAIALVTKFSTGAGLGVILDPDYIKMHKQST